MNIGKIWRRVMGIPDPQPPAPPVKDGRGWSEDWQVGDLARCKNVDWGRDDPLDPRVGDILMVSGLSGNALGTCSGEPVLADFLRFHGKPANKGWCNTGFTKIRPDHSADEIETGIINKIKGVKA